MNDKFEEFCRIAAFLSTKDISTLLFGSLGLQQRLAENLFADDIDILVPEIYITEKWDAFQEYISELGYVLEDLHEHQFSDGTYTVAFASIESLEPFAEIRTDEIPLVQRDGVEFFLLTLEQYLAVYMRSLKDGYRQDKMNYKDQMKIDLIQKQLHR